MNNPVYWEREYRSTLNESFRNKIAAIRKMIPSDVRNLLDVGCGNGVITNELCKWFNVTATDRSRQGLQEVRAKKFQTSANAIGLKSARFDLVFCSEVLEHLTEEQFHETIREIKRLSRKYILVTVPFEESILKNLVACPRCGTRFNKTTHVRSLNKELLQSLFDKYQMIAFRTFGKKVRAYRPVLEKIKHRWSPPESWIPPRWTPDEYRLTVCPQCSLAFDIPYRFHLVAFMCDVLNTLISPKKPYQMFALFAHVNPAKSPDA